MREISSGNIWKLDEKLSMFTQLLPTLIFSSSEMKNKQLCLSGFLSYISVENPNDSYLFWSKIIPIKDIQC